MFLIEKITGNIVVRTCGHFKVNGITQLHICCREAPQYAGIQYAAPGCAVNHVIPAVNLTVKTTAIAVRHILHPVRQNIVNQLCFGSSLHLFQKHSWFIIHMPEVRLAVR